MNPIKITLLALVTWIILVFIAGRYTHWDGLSVLFGGFFLAPIFCLTAFIVGSVLYYPWVKKNKNAFAVTWILLIIWLLIVTIIFFTR